MACGNETKNQSSTMFRSGFVLSSSSKPIRQRISRASNTFKFPPCYHFSPALPLSQRKFASSADAHPTSNSRLVLYDSLSQSYRNIDIAINESSVANDTNEQKESSKGYVWYTCGPTVYDDAHLGHARTYVCLDILQRALLQSHAFHKRPKPIFIMNITDVDDKILNRAKERNMHPIALARKYEAEFWEDLDALNVMRPTIITRVTDHVEDSIIPYIETIMEGGMAYEHKGSVYFDVKAFETGQGQGRINQYGKLAPHVQTTAAFLEQPSSEGVNDNNTPAPAHVGEEDFTKRDARDFVLWKGRDVDSKEESLLWKSPWGPGRPGWHIECSAMIESTMKKFQNSHKMYFHAGGVDLKFPHHTNEIAQAEAYHSTLRTKDDQQSCCETQNKEWIPHWIHTGHLHIEGRKMSKSLKNFITIRELLAPNDVQDKDSDTTSASISQTNTSILESPADDFRTWCLGLSGSYKSPTTYSKSSMVQAKQIRLKWAQFLIEGQEWITLQQQLREQQGETNPESSHDSGNRSSLCWDETDLAFFEDSCEMENNCQKALLGCVGSSGSEKEFDVDGLSYMNAMVRLADHGQAYMSLSERQIRPVEPMYISLQKLRSCLDIVGFSDATVRIGSDATSIHTNTTNHIVGGERAIVDELARFRKRVRDMALDKVKDESFQSFSKELLSLCDDLRDETLPSIGLEIKDTHSPGRDVNWRLCLPRKSKGKNHLKGEAEQGTSKTNNAVDLGSISTVEDFFRSGHYSEQFSSFSSDGVPTHDMTGQEISKRLRKKLIKKKNVFLQRLSKQ